MPYSLHRGIAKRKTYNDVFWAFGESEPIPSDFPSIKNVLQSTADDELPSMTLRPTPASISLTKAVPTFHESPFIPLSTDTTVYPLPSNSPDVNAKPTDQDADATHTRKLVVITVIVSCITGLGLVVGICKVLTTAGMCRWGARKGHRGIEWKAQQESGLTEKALSWTRLSSAPANFGVEQLRPKGTAIDEGVLHGRHYDEKGIERGRDPDDDQVFDVGQYPGYTVPMLTFQPPSENLASVNKPVKLEYHISQELTRTRSLNTLNSAVQIIKLPPLSFFEVEDHNQAAFSVSVSPSHVSNISSTHSRTQSAPGVSFPVSSNLAAKHRPSSTTSSEWDIARAYGGPRYDKAKSAGGMSAFSVDSTRREWEERMRRASDRNSVAVVK